MGRYIDTFLGETPSSEPQLDGYNPDARDGDNDGIVQEGTPFERPALSKTVRKKGK